MDLAADNARLRHELRRVIAEREIATGALRSILVDPPSAAAQAEAAIYEIMTLPRPIEGAA